MPCGDGRIGVGAECENLGTYAQIAQATLEARMLKFATLQSTDPRSASAIDRIETMSPEIVAIITVAIGLAGLILNGQRAVAELCREVASLREHVDQEFAAFREQMNQEMGALRERMAHLEGFLEGLREAIVGKAA